MIALHRFALAAALLATGAFAADQRPSPASPPNIVYILADDLGIGDVSCYNPKSAWQTPHLDRLAREGMRFTDAHSASSLCTPSRYAGLTGRYAWRGSLKSGVTRGYSPALVEPGRLTVPALLRQHGYTTAIFGKWHLGLDWTRKGPQPEDVDFAQPFGGGPLAHGFERFFGISASLDMPPYVWLANDHATTLPTGTIGDSPTPKLWRAGVISPDFKLEDVQPRLTGKAIAYLAERAAARDGKPFFLYLPLAAPHTPILLTREFEGKTRTTPYGDFVAQVDADIGRILAALDAHDRAKNTLVIVSSDNGFAPAANVPDHKLFKHDPSAGYRGVKSDLFEGGHRVPFIARWPGVTPAGTTCGETVGQFDLLATFAELLGTKLPDNAGEDSVSLLPLLRGKTPSPSSREALVHHSADGEFAIRQGKWKLLLAPGSGGWSPPTRTPSPWTQPRADNFDGLPPFQLYDLAADPAEKNNLAAARPEIVQRLGRLMRAFIERGRSTAGAPQPVPAETPWPQTAWREKFPDIQ
ncbi:MAG: arylsulfatase [Verrucomicrobia bacterium]|nr:arylsulfatase [Verrucomicrobiota bacterium]